METTIDFVEDLDNFIQSCEEKWKVSKAATKASRKVAISILLEFG